MVSRVTPRERPCGVLVTVDAALEVMPELEAHARLGLERFPLFTGFISGALHRSADGSRLVQALRWRSEADYVACIHDPHWDELPSTRRFMELIDSGAATLEVRVYEVVATSSCGD